MSREQRERTVKPRGGESGGEKGTRSSKGARWGWHMTRLVEGLHKTKVQSES